MSSILTGPAWWRLTVAVSRSLFYVALSVGAVTSIWQQDYCTGLMCFGVMCLMDIERAILRLKE